MEAAVKISREDMSARELRALAGRVKEGLRSRGVASVPAALEEAARYRDLCRSCVIARHRS